MEVHYIPYENAVIVYRPLRRLAFIGNEPLVDYITGKVEKKAGPQNLEIDEFLDSVGFWDMDEQPAARQYPAQTTHEPTSAALLLTNACNAKCLYCYAKAGESALEYMAWPTAKCAIDHVHQNAERRNESQFSLTFHGGGEPTLCWDVLVRSVDYARSRPKHCHITLTSNAMWTEDQAQYICDHFDGVTISMDGLPEVQNRQRPLAGGEDSFPLVKRTLTHLDKHGVEYGIRMTVMPDSVRSLTRSVKFLCSHTKARAIQIEPMYSSGHGLCSAEEHDMGEAFCEEFMEAYLVGKEAGRMVMYSAARPWLVTKMFCTAPTKSLIVASDGTLMACLEVFSPRLQHASGFVVGHIDEGVVEIDTGAVSSFVARQQARRQTCRGCFCYWHCCGDCVRRAPSGESGRSARCRVTKRVTRDLLISYVSDGDGLWLG